MTVEETITYLADKISDGIVAAWKNVAPGKISYGLDRNSCQTRESNEQA
jgi:hypothetical protein